MEPVASRPLCVDLDGTLIRSDILYESLLEAVRRAPYLLLLVPFWLLKGRANLKRRLAERIIPNPEHLPYNTELLEFLRAEHGLGRKLVLASASAQRAVSAIAEHLGIFSQVMSSGETRNLKGREKALALREEFGECRFDYIGDSPADIPVWEICHTPYVVARGQVLARSMKKKRPETVVFSEPGSQLWALVRALRPHQWVKNLLLFVPLIMAHRWGDSPALSRAAAAFISFCVCASSVYILNDLLDLESDRAHRSKKKRPFAAGDLSVLTGLAIAPLLLLLSFVMAIGVNREFVLSLLFYWGLTLAYSLYLKRIMLLDIVVLASLYTTRVLAGGHAAEVPVSEWLLGFSMFIFFSLACIKRYSELLNLRRAKQETSRGRGYRADDLEQIAQFGATSGYISVLVMALYVSSTEVMRLYSHPKFLWLICPVLLYWLSRIWLIAHRGELHEDPIVFALGDRVSYAVGAICLILMLLAV